MNLAFSIGLLIGLFIGGFIGHSIGWDNCRYHLGGYDKYEDRGYKRN